MSVSLCVRLPVRKHITGTAAHMRSSSVFVFVITCGRGSLLFRRRCYTSCARAVKEVGRFAAVYTFEKALVRSYTDHYSVSKKINR